MVKKYRDIISGSFLLLLALVVFIASFSIKRLTVTKIGSQFVPQIVCFGMAAVAIFIIYNGVKELKTAKELSAASQEVKKEEEGVNSKSVVATFLLIAVYIALLNFLGFIIATSLYLFGQFFILAQKDERKPIVFAITAVIVSVAIYYIFVSAFQLMLPAGILG